jgi:hypothetical protein
MLLKAEEGHIDNTSSVNGFWASVGPRIPHIAYSAAKDARQIAHARARIASTGRDVSSLSDDDIRAGVVSHFEFKVRHCPFGKW